MGFLVMSRPCNTCIFRKNSPNDLTKLLADVTDAHGFIDGYRICHHKTVDGGDACCRGFWNLYKDEFQLGQVAQRFDMVEEAEPAKDIG